MRCQFDAETHPVGFGSVGEVVDGDLLVGSWANGPGLLPAVSGERGIVLSALGARVAGWGGDGCDKEAVERRQVFGGGFDGEGAVGKLLAQGIEGRRVGDYLVVDGVDENGHNRLNVE